MLSLTIRSGRNGRFLAKVIDRDGYIFVLDYGDERLIADAHHRVAKGFAMWRFGKVLTVRPQTPDMVSLLADYYAGKGMLVFLEEPTWGKRTEEADNEPSGHWSGEVLRLEDAGQGEDPVTEVIDAPTVLLKPRQRRKIDRGVPAEPETVLRSQPFMPRADDDFDEPDPPTELMPARKKPD